MNNPEYRAQLEQTLDKQVHPFDWMHLCLYLLLDTVFVTELPGLFVALLRYLCFHLLHASTADHVKPSATCL